MKIPDSKLFEMRVAKLLRLAGFQVKPEMYISHKKVDLYAEIFELGKLRRYAVECKDWENVITLKQLQLIKNDYEELYNLHEIDVILLITKSGLAPAAQTYVSSARNLIHMTIEDLQCSIMDFSVYLDSLINDYEEDGLHRYYVPAQAINPTHVTRVDLGNVVDQWISKNDQAPIALLGGYGSGKTTFARHIAYHHAKNYRDRKVGRIPIFIKLGELCVEQTIDGLLGRIFASTYPIRGYSYGLFQELNRSGLFLIILDGFDEMKHSMTVSSFRFNFREVLKLATPNAKIILSGRPTAFLNEAERKEFLHASVKRGEQQFSIKGAPNFQEIEIAPFGRTQMTAFITKYQDYLKLEKQYKDDEIPTHKEFFQSEALIEIASRPVQLQMLFEVLPSYKGDLSQLTVKELYRYFIDMLIEREADKPARKNFSAKRRREFLQAFAFYMWIKNSPKLSIEDVPVSAFCRNAELDAFGNIDDARRDLVSGSFLDLKYPDEIFFPHRSIQEYLISEFLLSAFREEETCLQFVQTLGITINFLFLDEKISPEIIDFMIASIGEKDRMDLIERLKNFDRTVTPKVLKLWTTSRQTFFSLFGLAQKGEVLPFGVLVAGCVTGQWSTSSSEREDLYRIAVNLLESSNDKDKNFIYQTIYLAWILLSKEENKLLRDEWMSSCFSAFLRFRRTGWHKEKKEVTQICPSFIYATKKFFNFHKESNQMIIGDLDNKLVKGTLPVGLSSWYRLNDILRLSLVHTFVTDQDWSELLESEK
jgi:NACHT domain/Restriction endonuclease